MANIERLRQVLTLIKENPEHWDQTDWHCGTSHCFAGFADCLANNVDFRQDVVCIMIYERTGNSLARNGKSVKQVAQEWLELSESQADALFFEMNTLKDLERIINEIELGNL